MQNQVAIPVFKPWLTDLEKEYVAKAVEDGWVAIGRQVDEFAEALSRYIGVKYALPVCNGTAACHVAIAVHNFPMGSEIIIPDTTFIATANACVYAGCVPVPVDVEAGSWCISTVEIERAITSKTVAVMPVHLYGEACRLVPLRALCQKYHLALIEDACEALGSRTDCGTMAGAAGDTAALSFYGNKTITTGEGGAFLTDDEALYRRAKMFIGHWQEGQYNHPVIGHNLRMSNLAAALGCAQMARIREILAGKCRVDGMYQGLLGRQLFSRNSIPWAITGGTYSKELRATLLHDLADESIETRPVFPPIRSQKPYLQHISCITVARGLHDSGIVFPSYPQMSEEEFSRIAKVLRRHGVLP